MASTSSHSEARSNPPSVVRATIQDVCLWALQNSSSDILDIVYPVLVPEYQEKRWALKLCALVNAGIGCQPSASHRVVRLSCERENKRAVAPEELMHGLFARLSQAKDLGSGRGLPELCADFWDNVVKSGIKRLVIVLEKTHRLFDVLRSFEGFATGLLRVPPGPVSEAGVSVKIVVISSCKKAAEELMKKYGHCGESFDD
ncbi:hypothetical protein QBC40DRAFT_346990 [Triangularia verruculosa]|uniref:Uncharacterized protein n=1 Tax=Triangularia verruculosa TaxID=2587418 RepID=A0AAN6XL64_9PEZI|nr:hypothetical protein QBC40DRAFT_346990 [Triangularia verruculosa]